MAMATRPAERRHPATGAAPPGGGAQPDRRRNLELLELLDQFLERRWPHRQGRSARIVTAARRLGEVLNLPQRELDTLAVVARCHDIGLLAESGDSHAARPGDRTVLGAHAALGGRVIAKLFPLQPALAEAVWWHHERPDGGGPYGLRGEEIPLSASILALLDALHDLLNPDDGKAPALEELLAEVERRCGSEFEPRVVRAFRRQAESICDALRAPPRATATADSAAPAAAGSRHLSPATPPGPPGTREAPDGGPATTTPRTAPPASAKAPRPGTDKPLFSEQELLRRVQRRLELKPLPQTVHEVISVTSRPSCELNDVARAVALDQSLAIRILRLANGSLFSDGRKPVENVRQAVQRIGIQETRRVVMTLGIVEQYEGLEGEDLDPMSLWEHGLTCGLLASRLATRCGAGAADEFFQIGVLHDVGRMALLQAVPDAYASVMAAARESGLPLETAERMLLAVDHCRVAEDALEHWGFARDFIAPIAGHHTPVATLARADRRHARPAAIVALADRLAHAKLSGSSGNDVLYPLHELFEFLELRPEDVESAIAQAMEQRDETRTSLLARGSTEKWNDHADVFRARLGGASCRPLCVGLRPALDPVQMLLQRIGHGASPEAPNLAVVFVEKAAEQEALASALAQAERNAGCAALPVLLVGATQEAIAGGAWLPDRPTTALHLPLRIDRLLDAMLALVNATRKSGGTKRADA